MYLFNNQCPNWGKLWQEHKWGKDQEEEEDKEYYLVRRDKGSNRNRKQKQETEKVEEKGRDFRGTGEMASILFIMIH